jgi:DNA mismatch repair ATPase MutS
MDAVFAHLDRAETFAGRSRLYDRLRVPSTDLAALRRLDDVVAIFERDTTVRERIQSVLASIDPYGQDAVLEVLFACPPAPPRLRHLFPVVAVLTVSALAASLISPPVALVALTLAALSIALRVVYGRRMLGWMAALRTTSALLDAARRLGGLSFSALEPELATLRAARARLATLAGAARWLAVDTLRGNEIVVAVIAYINAFLLVDLMALAYCLEAIRRKREDIRALFESIGDLDAALAVASFRAGAGEHCKPEIDEGEAALCIEDVVHPLVVGPVPNSIRVEGRGILITGPNMSGKSTFARAVAINAVLAQTIYTTLARRYRAPFVRVRTLMSAEDDVRRSWSYYYAEVQAAKAMLEPSGSGPRRLIIVDELFRGTNTSERIGAGKAVLAALREMGHYVVASTHDRELVFLLGDHFDAYHFGEQVVGGELVFPFKLCPGPSLARNAIVLLRHAGFPPKVIADATRTAEALEQTASPTMVATR